MFYSHLQSFAIGIIIASITFIMFLNHKEKKSKEQESNDMINFTKSICTNQSVDTKLCEYLKKKYL
jgi:hypothetical protein